MVVFLLRPTKAKEDNGILCKHQQWLSPNGDFIVFRPPLFPHL